MSKEDDRVIVTEVIDSYKPARQHGEPNPCFLEGQLVL